MQLKTVKDEYEDSTFSLCTFEQEMGKVELYLPLVNWTAGRNATNKNKISYLPEHFLHSFIPFFQGSISSQFTRIINYLTSYFIHGVPYYQELSRCYTQIYRFEVIKLWNSATKYPYTITTISVKLINISIPTNDGNNPFWDLNIYGYVFRIFTRLFLK